MFGAENYDLSTTLDSKVNRSHHWCGRSYLESWGVVALQHQ